MTTPPDRERGRPGEKAPPQDSTLGESLTSVPPTPLADANIGRRYWARRMIDKAGGASIPPYGGHEWLSLPEGDPRKVAAVIVAAESWATAGDHMETDLRREMATMRREHKRRDDEEYADAQQAHREQWEPVAKRFARLTFLERRALQLADAAPEGGDCA